MLNFNSLHAPIKFVPLSERSCLGGPRIAKNRRQAFMKLEVDMDSNTSMCVALVLMHVNNTAHRLLSALPPRERRVTMLHGPKTSSPTWVKGGSEVSLSTGSGAIFCSIILPLSFLQVTQL